MIRNLSLISLTDVGVKSVKNSIERAATFRSAVDAAGGKVVAQYWSLGDKDGAVVFEVPDEATGTSLLLKLAGEGFVRTHTLRIFNEDEFRGILDRV